jgi:acetyltransferase-like isoleucine patch superfamily enzyme
MNIYQRIRRRLHLSRLKRKGVRLSAHALIDRTVDIHNHQNISLGEKSVLYKSISLYPSKEGRFEMGKNSHIAPFGYLLIDKNKVIIGDDVAIGPFCSFICHSNHVSGASNLFRENYLDGDISIGNNVFIGAQCTLLPGTIIPDNVVVASNSVVKGQLESGWVYGGTPVKKLKPVSDG